MSDVDLAPGVWYDSDNHFVVVVVDRVTVSMSVEEFVAHARTMTAAQRALVDAVSAAKLTDKLHIHQVLDDDAN